MIPADERAETDRNPMRDGRKRMDASNTEIPSIDPATATDEEKLAWAKARAANEPWTVALSSVIQDMTLMGIPLNPDLYFLGMGLAMTSGERGVRDFIDGITLASVARTENAGG